jgi:mannose-6-phosphate isomerase class I
MGRQPDFALRIFELTAQSAEQIAARCRVEPRILREGDGWREELLIGPQQTDCFTITRLQVTANAEVPKPPCVQVAVVVSGAGIVSAGEDRLEVRAGANLLAAAAAEALTWSPANAEPLAVLLCRPGR